MAKTAQSNRVARKRPWLAILLTFFIPGLGHLYLRMWGRAVLWLALYVLTTTLLVPDNVFPSSASFEAFVEAGEAMSPEVTFAVLSVSFLCMVDVYLMAKKQNERAASISSTGVEQQVKQCPNCGKDLDTDLEFCHWCTTQLDTADDE